MPTNAALTRPTDWWEDDWSAELNRHDVRYNVLAQDEPFFSLRTAAMKGPAGTAWVAVQQILAAADDQLSTKIQELLTSLQLPPSKFGVLWTALDRVRKVRATRRGSPAIAGRGQTAPSPRLALCFRLRAGRGSGGP